MKYSGIVRNQSFTDVILKKHQGVIQHGYGSFLVYRKKRQPAERMTAYNQMYQELTKVFNSRILQYEKKYYHTITSQDNRKFIRMIEQIHNHPGEKKQLVHLFGKLGIVTRNQKEWQETKQIVRKYEEELTMLKRKLCQQEEMVLQMKEKEIIQISAKNLTNMVMENIKREIRIERMRYGYD
ncbi:MAG: hypothetical protein K2L07_06930 [Lachnospiraceae bacterium]|nr:hypothetical protein [Lachnospiraceae bacterium]